MSKNVTLKESKSISSKLFSIMTASTFAAVSVLGVAPFSAGQVSAATTLQACTTTNNVVTTNLSTWDFTETRPAGHYELVENGLKIYTDTNAIGTPDPRKVAGYTATNFALSGLGTQTIDEALDYNATSGIEPGLQLVVDFDGDGLKDGLLVGEATYGNTWWLTDSSDESVKNSAPRTGGGFGSSNFGTINEWLAVYPNAKVQNIGFSLGSGVNAAGLIEKISLGCTDYTFTSTQPAPVNAAKKEDCKNSKWQVFTANYKNQGDCVSSVVANEKKTENPSVVQRVKNLFRM